MRLIIIGVKEKYPPILYDKHLPTTQILVNLFLWQQHIVVLTRQNKSKLLLLCHSIDKL